MIDILQRTAFVALVVLLGTSAAMSQAQWVPQSQMAKVLDDYNRALEAMEKNKHRPESLLGTMPAAQLLPIIDRDEEIWLAVVRSRYAALTHFQDQQRKLINVFSSLANQPAVRLDQKDAEKFLRNEEDALRDTEDDLDTRIEATSKQSGGATIILVDKLKKEKAAITGLRKTVQEARRALQAAPPASDTSPEWLTGIQSRLEDDQKSLERIRAQAAAEEDEVIAYHDLLRKRASSAR